MDNTEIEFANIVKSIYGNQTDEEFNLGMALVALLDSIDNPEEYTDDMLNFVFDQAESAANYFRLKYNDKILEEGESEI